MIDMKRAGRAFSVDGGFAGMVPEIGFFVGNFTRDDDAIAEKKGKNLNLSGEL